MISRRAEEMTPFLVMDVLERARAMEREGIDVVHLEVGEPDFDLPAPVTEAVNRAIGQGYTHYTHSCGDPELREAIPTAWVFGSFGRRSPSTIMIGTASPSRPTESSSARGPLPP